jgi:predicted cupin superfamily sugar epimerase/ubiquinone/menaquinone biosynthesis C-methylase UbiE
MASNYTNEYKGEDAAIYAKHGIEGTLLLAYREFPRLFQQYVDDTNVALDYGCGSGRSTRYLADMGFQVEGVDINLAMLSEAKQLQVGSASGVRYTQIDSGSITQRKSKNDLVFSTLVFLEFPTLKEMEKVVADIYRVAKFNGTVIILTVSDEFYQHDWVSVNTDLPENKDVKSGDPVYIELKEVNNLRLKDYYWTDEDYELVFKKCGFSVVELVKPMATGEEGIAWLDETKCSPYSIYVLKKTIALESAHDLAQERGYQPILDRGFFKEIDKSEKVIPRDQLSADFSGERAEWSTIELLMQAGQKWPFHKLFSTEKVVHQEGCDMTFHLVYPDGKYKKVYLGEEHDDAVKELIIEPGTWFAEEVDTKGGYSIIQATTYPGFNPDDTMELMHRYQFSEKAMSEMDAQTLKKFGVVSQDVADCSSSGAGNSERGRMVFCRR